MPSTITGETNDGTCGTALGSWAGVRASAGSTVSDITATRDAAALKHTHFSRRGTHIITRTFFEFDTSSVSVAPTEATLNIRGHGSSLDVLLDFIVVKSEQGDPLAAGDFNSFPTAAVTALGNSDGSGAGTFAGISGLTYSAEVTSWSHNSVNEIDLNATALHDIEVLDTFKVCLMEYDQDYLDIDGGSTLQLGMYFADVGDPASLLPSLVYEPGTAVAADNATFFGANF